MVDQLPSATLQTVIEVLWALPKLGASPSQRCVKKLLRFVGERLVGANEHDLSSLAYALACLDRPPSEPFLRALAAACYDKMPGLTPKQLANTVWAFARLCPGSRLPGAKRGRLPNEAWCGRAWACAGASAEACGSQDLAQLLWGLATLEEKPKPGHLAALVDKARSCFAAAFCTVVELFDFAFRAWYPRAAKVSAPARFRRSRSTDGNPSHRP